MSNFQLQPSYPLAGVARPGCHGSTVSPAGVTIRVVPDIAIALLTAGRSTVDARKKLGKILKVDLPESPRALFGKGQTILWAGPDSWLVLRENQHGSGDALFDQLSDAVGQSAAVVDLTDSRVFLKVAGLQTRAFFEKGVAVDLHPRTFGPGDTAITLLSHLSVQLWQVDNSPTYGFLVPRATAQHFWHWAEASSAEYGLEVLGGSSQTN